MVTVLGDVLNQLIDCEHKTAPETITDFFAYSVGTPHIRNGRILYDQAKRISAETYEKWTKRGQPQPGDLILAREAPVGHVGLVSASHRVALGQRTVLLKLDRDKCVPRYIHYKLLSHGMQRRMADWSEGSTVQHLNVRDIPKLELGNLPGLEEQKRIAEILGSMDDKIEANSRLLDSLSELAIAEVERLELFSEEPNSVLGDLITFSPKVPKPDSDTYQFIDMSVLPTTGPITGAISHKENWTGSKFEEGDTLFSRITPCLENGKTAIAMGLGDKPGIGSTEFIVMRALEAGKELLPYGIARNERFREIAIQKMTGTSGRQRVKWQDLASTPVNATRVSGCQLGKAEFELMRSFREENILLASIRNLLIRHLIG